MARKVHVCASINETALEWNSNPGHTGTLVSLLMGDVGKGFFQSGSVDDGWDRIVDDLVCKTASKTTVQRNAYAGDLGGLRGATAMSTINAVMRQGGFLVKNSFEEAFSAWENPELTQLGATIENAKNRFTMAELAKFAEMDDSDENQPPKPPERASLDLEFEGCSFVIFNINDQKPG